MATEPRHPTAQEQALAIGHAVRALRERASLTQEAAAAAFGVTRQAWQNYEAGARQTILRTDMQERIADALGVTRADLLRERDRQAGHASPAALELRGVGDSAKIYELPVLGRIKASPAGPVIHDIQALDSFLDVAWIFGPNARTLRVAGDSMTGYVESGQVVIYDVSQWPRRGDGCIVELTNGEVHVKEYQETGRGVLKVRQRSPDETMSFPMSEVKGVYLIRFRGG